MGEKNEGKFETDVVVLGTGAAGLCAAISAASGGARVVMLEKMPGRGGMTNFTIGIFAVESRYSKEGKCGSTVEQAFQLHMKNTHWMADARIVRTFMERSAETIDWLEGLGAQFSGIDSYAPDGPRVSHGFKGGAGKGLVTPLMKHVKAEKNIETRFSTGAKRLVTEKGRVTGVIAEDKEGNRLEFACKAVVIATGGYQDNKEWMARYIEGGEFIGPLIPSEQTGDGCRMAMEVGAAPEGMGVMQGYMAVPGEPVHSQLQHVGIQPYLWINQRGERFCDEGVRWDFPMASNTITRQPGAMGYCILDEESKAYLKEKGTDCSVVLPPGTPLADIDNELERGITDDKVFEAQSLVALAEKIGVDQGRFRDTVEEYNGCCDKNLDVVFSKDRKYLKPIRTPRFYAVKFGISALITEGGVKINHRAEVIDKEMNAVPGLFAAGCVAGGMMGDTYPLDTSGGSLGFAVNYGRIAGENALKYMGKS